MFIVNYVRQDSYPNENSLWHRDTLYIGCYYKCYLPLSTHIKLHSPLNFKLIFHQQKPPLPSFFFSIKLLMALTTSQIYTKLGKPCCKIEIWEGVQHTNPKEYSFVSITYSDVGPLTTTLLHFWELKPNKIAKANFSKITKCSLNPLFKLCAYFGQPTLTQTLEALLSFSNGFPMKTSWENLPKPSFWLVASISAD